MKLEDAPPPGWYPDPEGGGRLRWWEGTDWTDDRRAPASTSETENALRAASEAATPPPAAPRPGDRRLTTADTDQIVSQVREAAREEVARANEMLKQRATSTIEQIRLVLADYAKPVLRLIRIAIVIAAVLVIAWFVLQFIAQAAIFDWVGDRIDNVGNN